MSPPKARPEAVGSWFFDGLVGASKKGGLAAVCVVAGIWMTHEAGGWAGPNVIKPAFDDWRGWQRDVVSMSADAVKTNGKLVAILERQEEERARREQEDKRRDAYMEQLNITIQGMAKSIEHLYQKGN